MFITKLCFVVVLYIAASKTQIISTIDKDVQKHVNIEIPNDKYELDVYIGERKWAVGLTVPSSKMPKLKTNKTHVFYTALSCNLAYLTMNSLYDFSASSPLFYQHAYQRYGDVYETDFRSKFKGNFEKLLETVKTDTSRYIRMLNNVLSTKCLSSYYTDRSTLVSLLTLRVKIYALSSLIADEERQPSISEHRDVVRVVLDGMNEVQRSLLFNCKPMTTDGSHSQFYDYYVQTVDDKRMKRAKFLNMVDKKIVLTADAQTACSHAQIVLEEFVPGPTDPPTDFKREIFATIVRTTDDDDDGWENTAVTIRDVYERVKTAYASERAIFVYQDSLIAAIVKTIIKETLACLKNNYCGVGDVSNEIRAVCGQISADRTEFPECLVDGFAILCEPGGRENAAGELERFHDSLNTVRLTGTDRSGNNLSYLETILKAVTTDNAIASLKCFQESYGSLRDKHQKYYVPFVNGERPPPSADSSTANVAARSKSVCDFAANVYSLCFQAKMFSQNMDGKLYDTVDGNKRFGERLNRALKSIQHYFLLIVKYGSDDERLLKMAYDVAPMLVNVTRQRYPCAWDTDNVLQAVMVEMNSVGTRYCPTPDGDNFLLFNRMNFFELGNGKLIDESMKEFYAFSVRRLETGDLDVASIDANEFEYFNVVHLYANYIERSCTVRTYENVVKFYWDGLEQSIRYIYEDVRQTLKSSYNFYALIDMYFKFFVAVVYYEIENVLKSNHGSSDVFDAEVAKLNQCCRLTENAFPRALKPLVLDVNGLLDSLTSMYNDDKTRNEVDALAEKAGDRFKRFSIVFAEPGTYAVCAATRFRNLCGTSTDWDGVADQCSSCKPMVDELSDFVRENGDLFRNIRFMTTPRDL